MDGSALGSRNMIYRFSKSQRIITPAWSYGFRLQFYGEQKRVRLEPTHNSVFFVCVCTKLRYDNPNIYLLQLRHGEDI